MKRVLPVILFFIGFFAEAQVVCRAPSEAGAESTEAYSISEQCRKYASGTGDSRDVNAQSVVALVTSDGVSGGSAPSSGSSGAPPRSGKGTK